MASPPLTRRGVKTTVFSTGKRAATRLLSPATLWLTRAAHDETHPKIWVKMQFSDSLCHIWEHGAGFPQ